MKEKYLVTISLCTTMIVEAENEDDAREIVKKTPDSEMKEIFADEIDNSGCEIGTIEAYDD
jgi:hypothetical protein